MLNIEYKAGRKGFKKKKIEQILKNSKDAFLIHFGSMRYPYFYYKNREFRLEEFQSTHLIKNDETVKRFYFLHQMNEFFSGYENGIYDLTTSGKGENFSKDYYHIYKNEDLPYEFVIEIFFYFMLDDGFVNFGVPGVYNQGEPEPICTGEIKRGEYFFLIPFMWTEKSVPFRCLRDEDYFIKEMKDLNADTYYFHDLYKFFGKVSNPDMRLGAKEVVPYAEFDWLDGVAGLQQLMRMRGYDKANFKYIQEFMKIDVGDRKKDWEFELVYSEDWGYEKKKKAAQKLIESKDFEKLITESEWNEDFTEEKVISRHNNPLSREEEIDYIVFEKE